MPIKGLSETRRIPRLGKLRLGIKVKTIRKSDGQEIEVPKAVDYFVVASDDPEMVKEFKAIYGEQPRELPICFPTDHPDDWSSQFYRNYTAGRGLVCKGDGESASRLVFTEQATLLDPPTAGPDPSGKRPVEWKDIPCLGRDCPHCQARRCKPLMMLQFILPRLRGLGIWQLDTSSVNSIININSGVELVRRITGGRIAMRELILKVVPVEVSPEGQKKTVFVLQLDIQGLLTDLARQPALGSNPALMLPEPDEPPDPAVTELLYPDATPQPTRVIDTETGEINQKLEDRDERLDNGKSRMEGASDPASGRLPQDPVKRLAALLTRFSVRRLEADEILADYPALGEHLPGLLLKAQTDDDEPSLRGKGITLAAAIANAKKRMKLPEEDYREYKRRLATDAPAEVLF